MGTAAGSHGWMAVSWQLDALRQLVSDGGSIAAPVLQALQQEAAFVEGPGRLQLAHRPARRSGAWTPQRAANRQLERWRRRVCSAKVEKHGVSKDLAGLKQTHQNLLDGLVFFKRPGARGRGGKRPLSWPTILRIISAPATVGAEALQALAFGSHVSATSVRRTRVRIAAVPATPDQRAGSNRTRGSRFPAAAHYFASALEVRRR